MCVSWEEVCQKPKEEEWRRGGRELHSRKWSKTDRPGSGVGTQGGGGRSKKKSKKVAQIKQPV